jgi:hypothetical protein
LTLNNLSLSVHWLLNDAVLTVELYGGEENEDHQMISNAVSKHYPGTRTDSAEKH